MNTDVTVLMFIAVVEAIVIGLLLADKLGLIKDTEIDNNPKDNKRNTNNTEYPSRTMEQRGCNKYGQNKNDHATTNEIGKPLRSLISASHYWDIIKRTIAKYKQNRSRHHFRQRERG